MINHYDLSKIKLKNKDPELFLHASNSSKEILNYVIIILITHHIIGNFKKSNKCLQHSILTNSTINDLKTYLYLT